VGDVAGTACGPPTPQASVSLCAATAVKKVPGGEGTTFQPPDAAAGTVLSSAVVTAITLAPNNLYLRIWDSSPAKGT
jgi:hypothetical protein